jgi:hypothetical protein
MYAEWYTREVLSKIEQERRESPHSNHRWQMELQMLAPPRRPLAMWLGDHFVAVGEWLHRWSASETYPMQSRRALPD